MNPVGGIFPSHYAPVGHLLSVSGTMRVEVCKCRCPEARVGIPEGNIGDIYPSFRWYMGIIFVPIILSTFSVLFCGVCFKVLGV